MNEIITSAIAIIAMVSGLVSLVVFVRRDNFAGPGTGYTDVDDLGAVVRGRRQPVPTLR
ncbi:hypothetical protein [Nocardioides marmorisolisilvae]|uniref:hypothetical protein n=1 Tax=Nocardioides marmorisolisilvae TaxID=1542737 RepID=UPI001610A694|nr:hypothetical protein [Nocardioides marmorisolisilvae]